MPRSDSPHSTPASGVNRRGLLAAAGGLAAAGALVALPASAGTLTSPRIERFRWLAAECVRVEALLGCKAQEEELGALNDQISDLCQEVWATPVRGPIDVLERAFAAHDYWARSVNDDTGEHVLSFEGRCEEDESALRLIEAVLQLADAPEGGANVV